MNNWKGNLQFALNMLNNTDQALANAHTTAGEAHTLMLATIDSTSSPAERESLSFVVDGHIQSLLEAANRQIQGVSLFGGQHRKTDQPVFIETLGGIQYTGAKDDLAGELGLDQPLAFTTNGADAFGALSVRIKSQVDLDPQATPATRLSEVNGVQGKGIRKGVIAVSIDGNPAITVDLNTADNLNDVVTRINDVINNNFPPAAGSIGVTATGLSLTANAGRTIAISDIGSGQTAADLGIAFSATGGTLPGQTSTRT